MRVHTFGCMSSAVLRSPTFLPVYSTSSTDTIATLWQMIFFFFYIAVSLPFYHSQEPRTVISGRLSKDSELPSVSSLSPEYVQNIALCTSRAAGSPWMFDVSLLSGLSFDSTFLFPLSFLCLLPLLFLSCIFCQLAHSPDFFGQENSTELFGKR